MNQPGASVIRTIDYHTGGEPFRIVVDGTPFIPGATMAERRRAALATDDIDAVRRFLCHEPRGHADMYGCYLFAADSPDADFAAMFWHSEGYPPSCGHGTMALGAWAVTSGRVKSDPDGITAVTIDVPAGRAVARVRMANGVVTGVWLDKGSSYPVAHAVAVDTSTGRIPVDLSFSGALYASVEASALGLTVSPAHYRQLIASAMEIRTVLNDRELEHHPEDDRLDGVFGVVVYEDLGDLPSGPHQRSIMVFNDGWVDRSPCGSATGARMALLAEANRLGDGTVLTHDSVVGARFLGRAYPAPERDAPEAILVEVEGMAYRTGEHTFERDADDPLGAGFLLR
jgi:proline racemase